MRYDISKPTAPMLPRLGKGTECIKILLSQVSKDMYEPLIPMFFPILGAHVSGSEFQYPDLTWKELCGMMANLVADSGCNKGQLSLLVEAICRDFRVHDEGELKKLVEWQKQVKTKGANKEKPARPDVAIWFPPSDITNAAFIQNSMGCEALGARTQYLNMPEVEMADKMCGGHKQVTQMLRNIYDRQRAGALRATADGITGNPILRTNLTISSTPFATRKFYKNDLFNGTFGRMVFSYKPRTSRDGRIPRQGKYSEEFYQRLDEFLVRLDICKGRYIIRPLNKLTDKLAGDMASWATLPTTTCCGTSRSVRWCRVGRLAAFCGYSTIRRGRSRWANWWNGLSITTSGARCRSLQICSTAMPTRRPRISGVGLRTCSTTCLTPSTRHSWQRYAPASARAPRALADSYTNGCSASSSPTRKRRDCTPRRRST